MLAAAADEVVHKVAAWVTGDTVDAIAPERLQTMT
jgi:hypothetical protein